MNARWHRHEATRRHPGATQLTRLEPGGRYGRHSCLSLVNEDGPGREMTSVPGCFWMALCDLALH
jgi:hypothetical protein